MKQRSWTVDSFHNEILHAHLACNCDCQLYLFHIPQETKPNSESNNFPTHTTLHRPGRYMGGSKHAVWKINANLNAFHDYWDQFEKPKGSTLCYNTPHCIQEYKKLPKLYPCFWYPNQLITGKSTKIQWIIIEDRSWTESAIISHRNTDNTFGRDSRWDLCNQNFLNRSSKNATKTLDNLAMLFFY